MIKLFTQKWQFSFFGNLSENKAWEFEGGKLTNWAWFDIMFKWTRKRDHAGLDLYIEILGFWLNFQIYDGRHWNYDQNRFYFPNEQLQEIELEQKEELERKQHKFYIFRSEEGMVVEDFLTDHEMGLFVLHTLQTRPNGRFLIEKTIEYADKINEENERAK